MNAGLQKIFYPLSILYKGATAFRNHLYEIGSKKTIHFEVPTISVGNLTVGGTGKTPLVEYLIRLLKENYPLATLSRGYGRKTRGFLLANETSSATNIGDEPFQFYLKFKEEITVAVGEERILAIPEILANRECKVIILDDAFQHRKVERDINILISDYNNPFYRDYVLPAGRLRESREGAKRANVIIVSKCPSNISDLEKAEIKEEIYKYTAQSTPIFFTTIRYAEPVALNGMVAEIKGKVLAVSGIAKPDLFEGFIRKQYNFFTHIKFKDHHHYSVRDIKNIVDQLNSIPGSERAIVTTEKDMVKWQDPSIKEALKGQPVFYIPIEVEFIDEKEKFESLIINKINQRLKEVG